MFALADPISGSYDHPKSFLLMFWLVVLLFFCCSFAFDINVHPSDPISESYGQPELLLSMFCLVVLLLLLLLLFRCCTFNVNAHQGGPNL